jgi:hypothetical protein
MKRISTRIFSVIILFFLVVSAYAAFSSSAIIHTKEQKIVNQKRYFTIKVDYPLVMDTKKHPLPKLNRLIKRHVQNHINEFRHNVMPPARLEHQQRKFHMMALTNNSNTLTISYQPLHTRLGIFSFRFALDTYYYGAAHGNRTYETFTYDNQSGKALALNDLFLPKTNYLTVLSQYSRDALLKKLVPLAPEAKEMVTQQINAGTAPIAKNFQHWNLTPRGLLITFPPYQVVAYVYGTQEVLIPYQTLAGALKPGIAAKI